MRLQAEVIHARNSPVTYARWENLVLPLRFAQRMEGWENLPVPHRTAPLRRAIARDSRRPSELRTTRKVPRGRRPLRGRSRDL